MDTQWPRFEVFKQDAPNQPHQNVGTVHAPDGEMALLNARDVFGRRPSCYSLWVVPERAILSVTAEELSSPKMQQSLAEARNAAGSETLKTYLVFQKATLKRAMTFVTHLGEVEASSPQNALAQSMDKFDNSEVWVWWVCPAEAVTSSDPGVVDSWFAPANDKIYRQQSYYGNIKRPSREKLAEIAQQLSQARPEENV